MSARVILIAILAFAVLEICFCMTTTHKPNLNEIDNYGFYYDPASHMLGLSNHYHHTQTCYVMKLTAEEQKLVKTVDGMTRLQLKMLTHLSSATTAMTLDELNTASTRLGHYCTKATNIYSMVV